MLESLISTLRQTKQSAVRVIESAADRAAWDHFVETHPMSRSVYPMYYLSTDWRELPIGLFRGDQLYAGMLLTTRRLPHLPISVSRILSVMVPSELAAETTSELLSGLDELAPYRGLIETEVQLRLPEEQWREVSLAFGEHGYRRLPRVEKSYFIRIDRSDDELLASFGQQPRNRIRKAKKDGAEVFRSRDPALLELFYESYLGTVDRKNIRGVLDRRQVIEGMTPLLERGRALIFGEKYGEVISNMIIVDPLGTPCAMLASRTRANVEGKVASCAQLVHFEAMRAMRERGHRWYDFGGCEGPVPIESHPNFGVWRFKHAFKGSFVSFIPSLRKIRGELTESLLTLLHRHRGDPVSLF
jgi:hypothetical protein